MKKIFVLFISFMALTIVSAKEVDIYFHVNGGNATSSNVFIEDGFVQSKKDYSYYEVYNSNATIKNINTISGETFSITKNGKNLTKGFEWYALDSKGGIHYFSQSKSYSVASILKELNLNEGNMVFIDLYANWDGTPSTPKTNPDANRKVTIYLNANGGKKAVASASKFDIVKDEIYIDKKLYSFTFYGETSDKGLPNYNGKKSINIVKLGYFAKPGEEWCSGPKGNKPCYSQVGQKFASDFCKNSSDDCTLTLYVNWVPYNKLDEKDKKRYSASQLEALYETAEAYHRKESKIQYSTGRASIFSPEQATSEVHKFTVCSGFVRNVYNETFGMGIELPDYRTKYYNDKNKTIKEVRKGTVKYIYDKNGKFIKKVEGDIYSLSTDNITAIARKSDHEKYGIVATIPNTEGKYKNFRNSILKLKENKREAEIVKKLNIKSGDILNYSNMNKKPPFGHVVLVLKEGNEYYIYQSVTVNKKNGKNTGDKKNIYSRKPIQLNDATYGSINKKRLADYMVDKVFKESYKNKDTGKKEITNNIYISVYRPIENTMLNVTSLSDNAKARRKYRSIEIDKSEKARSNSYLDSQGYVASGDIIIYKIVIKNNSNSKYSGLSVIENITNGIIQKNTSSIKGDISGNQISWVVDIAAGKSVTLTYEVKVTGPVTAKIVSNGSVGDIKSATITNTIFNPLSLEERKKLENSYKSKSIKGNTFTRVNKAYYDVFGINLNLSADTFNKTFSGYSLNTNGPLSDIVLEGYNNYNNPMADKIYYFSSVNPPYSRIGYPNVNHLRRGDILVYEDVYTGIKNGKKIELDSSVKNDCIGLCAYMYVGNGEFLGYKDNNVEYKYKTGSYKDRHNHFSLLMGKTRYVIYRPSLRFKR